MTNIDSCSLLRFHAFKSGIWCSNECIDIRYIEQNIIYVCEVYWLQINLFSRGSNPSLWVNQSLIVFKICHNRKGCKSHYLLLLTNRASISTIFSNYTYWITNFNRYLFCTIFTILTSCYPSSNMFITIAISIS